jgi:hypothetical protein
MKIALSVIMMAASLLAMAPQASAQSELATITVQGSGAVAGTPDQARLTMTISRRHTSVQQAKQEVDQKMQQLTAMVQKVGVANADLNNAPQRIYPEYQQDQSKIELYRVERELTLLVRDLKLYPELLEQASALGVNQLQPAELLVSQPQPLYQKALQLAFEDAKAKAEQLAVLSGRKVVRVHQIQEQGTSPAPRYKMAMMADESVQFGSNEVRADLTIQFELAGN